MIKKISMKLILKTSIITLLLTFISCNNTDYNKLKAENKRLKDELKSCEGTRLLIAEQRDNLRSQLEQNNAPEQFWPEAKALECLQDYYEFYERDYRYKDEIIRRSDNNSFQISLKQDRKHGDYWQQDWNAVVYSCHIRNDGTYEFIYESGMMIF